MTGNCGVRGTRIAGMLTGLALLSGGCGSGDVREMEPDRAPDLSLITAGSHADYEVAESPEQLLELDPPRTTKAVVVGAVEGIEQGRDIYAVPDDPEPAPYLVLRVRVSETLMGAGKVHDGRVYVEMWQGGVYNDGSGPRFSVEDWEKAIPQGTPVMLFLLDNLVDKNGDKTENDGRGVPDGATLMIADPQGMIFEYDGQLVGEDYGGDADFASMWDVSSIEDISARVGSHLAKNG